MSTFSKNSKNHHCFDPFIGWYTPGGGQENMDEFATFLHNPWGFHSKKEQEEIDRVLHIVGNPVYAIRSLLRIFFGNRKKNQEEGLTKQYTILKEHIMKEKLLGLILWGADINNINQTLNEYTTPNHQEITLTINSICQCLIKEYIKKENIQRICVENNP